MTSHHVNPPLKKIPRAGLRNPVGGLVIVALALAVPLLQARQVRPDQIPDAGRVQRDSAPPPVQPPRSAPDLQLDAPGAGEPTEPGGPTVQITKVEFVGNTLLDEATLQAALAGSFSVPLDLAGIRSLAERVSAAYRAAGYPFVRAYLPPQELRNGVLQLAVLEGRYGRIDASGDERPAAFAKRFLRGLRPGDPIESAPLDRRLLILADQPGLRIAPLIRSGEEPGAGDLLVNVERTRLLHVDAGYDNHGSSFTGENRLRLNLRLDGPFGPGHRLSVSGVSSTEDLWLGNVDYGLPVGVEGWRLSVGHARTAYQLGGDFKPLEASGTADVSSLGLSYPVRRSAQSNVSVVATLQNKSLRDQLGAFDSDEKKTSRTFVATAQLAQQSGNLTIDGSVNFTAGTLRLQGDAATNDQASGRGSAGGFAKWNMDLAALRGFGDGSTTLFAKISLQQSDGNLDSSEKFSLGGPYAVRAYPIGEGNGDEGVFVQVELRKRFGWATPYLFHDAGRARLNARPDRFVIAPRINHRSVAGSGVGVRFVRGGWNIDGLAAWRSRGGPPQAEEDSASPQMWLSVGYRFGQP